MLFLVKVYPITTVSEKKQSQISVIPADEEGEKSGGKGLPFTMEGDIDARRQTCCSLNETVSALLPSEFKILASFFTLDNLSPYLNSKLKSIQSTIAAKSTDAKNYAADALLKPLIYDIKILESGGLKLKFQDEWFHFYGTAISEGFLQASLLYYRLLLFTMENIQTLFEWCQGNHHKEMYDIPMEPLSTTSDGVCTWQCQVHWHWKKMGNYLLRHRLWHLES